jgi:uncharacterized protein (TIGR00369 family)
LGPGGFGLEIHREEGTYLGCFGCGPDNPVGLRMRFFHEADEVVSRLTLGREYAGYADFVHGGVLATMLDEAMGWAIFHLADSYAVTRSLQVDYRRPVYVGRVLARAAGDWVRVRRDRASAGAPRP